MGPAPQNIGSGTDNWIVGLGGCVAPTNVPTVLVKYDAILLSPGLTDLKVTLDESAPSSFGPWPGWSDCDLVERRLEQQSLTLWVNSTATDVPTSRRQHQLGPNRPNPFNPRTEVSFYLATQGRARVDVFDVRGRLVRVLVDSILAAGAHQRVWDGRDEQARSVASGVYFVRLEGPDAPEVRRAVLVR